MYSPKTETGKKLESAGLIEWVNDMPYVKVMILELDGRNRRLYATVYSDKYRDRLDVGYFEDSGPKEDQVFAVSFTSSMLIPIAVF